MICLFGFVPGRWLFAWFTKTGAAALFSVLITFGALAQNTPDGIRVMRREKSLAEQFLVLLNRLGPKDMGQYAKGIILYAEAKADFDGLITQLENELDQAQPPNQSEKFEAALTEAVAKRDAFTSFVKGTLVPPSDAAEKGIVSDFIEGGGALIKALTDSGIAIWRQFQSGSEVQRKEIKQVLESLRWPQFALPDGKRG